ncbi:MAG: MBL fold metallo-hydrolase, partial [Patescibacteria group bacterium]|nr:MBL fold metallo-hydrolase [Patescibacteria group bacterium]MDW8279743.1 MBL fold metallo-hydrolase [bacterium]
MNNKNNLTIFILIILFIFDIFLWRNILFFKNFHSSLYFLDVGQGDSTLFNFNNKIFILVDAGPNNKVVSSLDKILKQKKNYIDLAIITHPQIDHFGGFFDLLESYDFGAFIINGLQPDLKIKNIYSDLIEKIKSKNIPVITLGAKDKILYDNNLIEVLSPDLNWLQSAELNDTGLVLYIKNHEFSSLLTSDINSDVEEYLLNKYDLRANILKIAHHGSKYSSNEKFLLKIKPNLALIGVG